MTLLQSIDFLPSLTQKVLPPTPKIPALGLQSTATYAERPWPFERLRPGPHSESGRKVVRVEGCICSYLFMRQTF